jgi:hypothetical protein
MTGLIMHSGGCHCGRVRFEVLAPARHLFCAVCGVKSFYVPRSHPDGYSVNARCLDPGTVEKLKVEPFDGQQWERSMQQATLPTS